MTMFDFPGLSGSMATTGSVPAVDADLIKTVADWLIGICILSVLGIAACCICCNINKLRRCISQLRQQQQQTLTVPMTVEERAIMMHNNGTFPQQNVGFPLPIYNQQRPPQTATQPYITGTYPNAVTRVQYPPQQAVQQQYTQATKYIQHEVPAPDSHDKSPQAAISNPDKDKMAKYITRSITKVLEAINIDPEKIKREDILGSGQFGVVYKGEMIGEKSQKTQVAMKTVVGDSADDEVLQEFMDEVLRMKNFNHTNVMPMLGMTIMDDKPYMVLPYMENGDMKSFISKPTKIFTVKDLLAMAFQVSRGMEYLSGQKIIHGDLAARNCMVGKDDTVKVADFGLSRHLVQSDYYSLRQSETPRPIRWMAVECFVLQKFSRKSDVWSFGILLWEIMTRGHTPYPDAPTNMEVIEKVKSKYRMPCPQYCPEEIYEVMRRSWEKDPANRPSFKDTTKMIRILLDKAGGYYERPIAS